MWISGRQNSLSTSLLLSVDSCEPAAAVRKEWLWPAASQVRGLLKSRETCDFQAFPCERLRAKLCRVSADMAQLWRKDHGRSLLCYIVKREESRKRNVIIPPMISSSVFSGPTGTSWWPNPLWAQSTNVLANSFQLLQSCALSPEETGKDAKLSISEYVYNDSVVIYL